MNHWWFENKPSNIIYAEILSTPYGDCSVFCLFIEIGTTSVITHSISCTSESIQWTLMKSWVIKNIKRFINF